MIIQAHEKALIDLYGLMKKGSGEHARLLMPTEPLDRDLPEGHCWVSNSKDDGASDQIHVSKDSIRHLEAAGCIEHPYLNKGHRNPFTLSERGVAYAKRIVELSGSLDGST